jgi:hypothetical protein
VLRINKNTIFRVFLIYLALSINNISLISGQESDSRRLSSSGSVIVQPEIPNVLDGWAVVSGEWLATDGSALSPDNLYSNSQGRGVIRVTDDLGLNYGISTRVQALDAPSGVIEPQVVFRYVDSDNYYFAGIGVWGYKAGIARVIDGNAVRIAEGGAGNYADLDTNVWYDLDIVVEDNLFTVYVDGEEICSVTDVTHTSGAVGLTSYNSELMYDYMKVFESTDQSNILFEDYFGGSRQGAVDNYSPPVNDPDPPPTGGLRVGVTYYGNYQDWSGLPDSVLERDFARFRSEGIDLIILPTYWNVLESSQGSYSNTVFNRLIHITTVAAQYNINVVHNIHTWYTGSNVPSYAGNQRNVFIDSSVKQGWLDFVQHYVSVLDAPNLESFQVFNELSYHSWSMDVTHEQFYQLSQDTYQAAKSVTSKLVSARWSGDGTNGMEDRMYGIFDYFCVNYYDAYNEPSQLRGVIAKAQAYGKEVWVTEYGLSTSNDASQAQRYESNLALFVDEGVDTAVNWWWSGLSGVGDLGYNVADGNGNPRPAFNVMVEYDSR